MILFLHIPGFYASVEQSDHPELRGKRTLVGGDPRKRGLVTSASAEARAAGVREGMPMADALGLCPGAEVRPTRLRRYREVATAVRTLCWGRTDRVEPAGLEGVYLEVPDGSDPLALAAELCLRVRSEQGLPAVAGLGPTRFVAYAAARHCGEEAIRMVDPETARSFLADLPLSELWGLGPASAARLAEHGLQRIGDLQRRSPEELETIVGRQASTFHRLAMARDDDRIRVQPRSKSISQEETLREPTGDLATLRERLSDLAARVGAVLEREGRGARTVTLGVRFLDDQELTRGQTETQMLVSQPEILEAALALLGRAHAGGRLIRRLRLQVSNLSPRGPTGAPRQLSLF
jgi:DNA polymerase-4